MAPEPSTPTGGEPAKRPSAKIYVMPEQFLAVTRGAGLPVAKAPPPPVQPQAASSKPQAPPTPIAAVPPSTAVKAGLPPEALAKGGPGIPMEEGKRKMIVIWGGVAAVILIGGGLAAFFALRSVKPSAPPTPPAPRPVNVAPPAPVNVAPVNVPPVNEPPVNLPPINEPPPPAPDRDTDEDGLTDAEELLLGTDIGLSDSDGDSYPDAQELANLYNPAGVAPQRILDSGLVYEYEHPTHGWSIYLPRQWSIAATDQEQSSLTVSTELSTEQIVIHVSEDRTLGACTGVGVVAVRSKRGASGCRSTTSVPFEGEGEAGYVAEFSLSGSLVVRLGHLTAAPPPRFPHLFEMIVQSFTLPSSSAAE